MAPHLSPRPFSLIDGAIERGMWDGRCESMLAPPRAMIARVRYVPNEKSRFLIKLLERRRRFGWSAAVGRNTAVPVHSGGLGWAQRRGTVALRPYIY